MPVELTIVAPTRNERPNIDDFIVSLGGVLEGVDWRLVVVDDDSDDGTAARVRWWGLREPRVTCLQRRPGVDHDLSAACIEGLRQAAPGSRFLAVMDADMQHDERLLPLMLEQMRAEAGLDLVIGSRYIGEGRAIGGLSLPRWLLSRGATLLAGRFCPVACRDPMSGYFMLRRDFFEGLADRLHGRGYKLLLDILACAGPGIRLRELPYRMRRRRHGRSKLGLRTVTRHIGLLKRHGLRS